MSPVGIYTDCGNEFGAAVVDQSVWKDWVSRGRALNTSLFLRDGSETNALRDELRLQFPGLDIRNAGELRRVALWNFLTRPSESHFRAQWYRYDSRNGRPGPWIVGDLYGVCGHMAR